MNCAVEVGIKCRDIHTNFHKDWFMHSEVYKSDTHTPRQQSDLIRLLSRFFFQKQAELLLLMSRTPAHWLFTNSKTRHSRQT
jgi:hypothetical protein